MMESGTQPPTCPRQIDADQKSAVTHIVSGDQEAKDQDSGGSLCPFCDQICVSKEALKTHLSEKCRHTLRFQCHICEEELKTKDALIEHFETTHGQIQKDKAHFIKGIQPAAELVCCVCRAYHAETLEDLELHKYRY